MPLARKVALRVNGRHMTKTALRRKEKELELVIVDPLIGELVIDESFTVEPLELVHPARNPKESDKLWLEESVATDIDCAATERHGPRCGGERAKVDGPSRRFCSRLDLVC